MDLSTYLLRSGLSQKDLARLSGVNQSSISRFLRGQHGLSLGAAAKVSKATHGKVGLHDLAAHRPEAADLKEPA